MTTRTFDVDHPGTHYPTDAQSAAELRKLLKANGLKLSGDASFFLVENTSGGPSKVRATFETEDGPATKDEKPAPEKK